MTQRDPPQLALPMTLRPSPWKTMRLLLICSCFVAIGVWMSESHDPWNRILAWVSILFFGLGVLLLLLNLVPGASFLRLESQDFQVRTLFRTVRVKWSDIDSFSVARPSRREMVCWNYVAGRGPPSRLRAFNKERFGFEAAFPDTYGRKAQDLAATLDSIRVRQSNIASP